MPNPKEITVPRGNGGWEVYTYIGDMFCPGCGWQSVWVSSGEDYYVGPTHICAHCKTSFNYGESKGSEADIKAIVDFLAG